MDMMFVHGEGFRNDVKAFVNFLGKFLVSIGKPGSQFFFGKCMSNGTCWKYGQIEFAFVDNFLTMIRRTITSVISGSLRESCFRYSASLKKSNRENWSSTSETEPSDLRPKKSLVYDTDMLHEQFNLTIII